MKTVFLGSGEFSRDVLRRLLEGEFEISAVITRPDRPAGRGLKRRPTPVRVLATAEGMDLHLPPGPEDREFMSVLEKTGPDVLLVCDYGYMLPREILKFPSGGCVNLHPSLLPRYRGADPIRRALMNGDARTGVTLMLMDEGMDTGPVIAGREVEIADSDDAGTLRGKLAEVGSRMIEEFVPPFVYGEIKPIPQDEGGASCADPLSKKDMEIDWRREAGDIRNQVRALSPRPGAFTRLRGKRVKILEAELREDVKGLTPASLSVEGSETLLVGTGKGALRPLLLQPEGRKPVRAEEFLRGYRIERGEAFE